jgi:hypothetical protein
MNPNYSIEIKTGYCCRIPNSFRPTEVDLLDQILLSLRQKLGWVPKYDGISTRDDDFVI